MERIIEIVTKVWRQDSTKFVLSDIETEFVLSDIKTAIEITIMMIPALNHCTKLVF